MQPGEVLAGRYELHDIVGRGGMGEVFRATDRSLGREVAVKVLPRHLLGDDKATERFRREAQLAASLHHPHTVTVHDVVQGQGVEAIVMEFVDGPTLADVIADTDHLPWERALRIAASVADALDAAHARGLVHRDVKPSNVLIAHGDTIKVTDFGIARMVESSQTVTGTVYGSVPYLAPEQALGDPTDARTDVYGLGCLLYEMLTGRPPYVADDAVGTVYQHLHADPMPPSQRNPTVPAVVDDIVLTALERDPDRRYPSAADFAVALRDGAEGRSPTQVLPPTPAADQTRPVAAPFPAPAPRGGRPRRTAVRRSEPRRSPMPLIVALVVLVFLVLWLVGAFDESSGEPGALPGASPSPTVVTEATPPASETATSAPSPTTSPPQSPTPTQTPTETDSPATAEEAAQEVRASIAEARSNGDLTAKAENELDKQLSEVMKEHDRDNDDKALEKLDEMREQLRKFIEEGEATERAAELIEPELDDLETALRS